MATNTQQSYSIPYTCGSCNTTIRALWIALAQSGWVRHVQNDAVFIMCGACEAAYATLRAMRDAA